MLLKLILCALNKLEESTSTVVSQIDPYINNTHTQKEYLRTSSQTSVCSLFVANVTLA